MTDPNFWYICDPIALLDLETSETIQALRDGIEAIRSRFNHLEALCLYSELKENADQAGDLESIALTQLLLADAMARCGALSLGTYWARRSALCFTLLGDKHNAMVAHLLLGLLQHITQRRGEARQGYKKALSLCRELALNAKERAQSRAGRAYTEISEELKELLRNASYPAILDDVQLPTIYDPSSPPSTQELAHPESSSGPRRWHLCQSRNWCYTIGMGYVIKTLKIHPND